MISFGGAKHDVWISAIIVTFLGMAGGYLMIVLALRYPSCTIIQYSQIVLGKWLGKLVGLVYIVFFILAAATVSRDFSEIFLNFLYPYIPISVIVLTIIIVCVYAITLGLQLIARLAELIAPFILLVIIFGIIASIPNMNFSALTPILKNGWTPVVRDAVTELPWIGLAVPWLFILPQLEIKTKAKKTLLLSIFIVGFCTFLVGVTNVLVLGPLMPLSANYQFYSLFRLISISRYIERFEPIFLIAWIGTAFLMISTFYYIALTSIKELFNLNSYRLLIIPVGALIIYLSVKLFPSYMDLRSFFSLERFGLIALPIEFGIPLLLLTISYIRGK
ncbi:MAG: endospore germination permease [Syntrophomonas sp.]|nr:endospore germination permease [Syntrophomonas sp.]